MCWLLAECEESLEHLSFLFGFLADELVNVNRGVCFCVQTQVIDLYHFRLSDSHRACNGLIHQCCCPPGTDKDDAIVFLEIEPYAARLELE